MYVCWGRVLDDGVDGRMTYVGRGIVYIWISQTMGIGDIWKVLEKEMRESMSERPYKGTLMAVITLDVDNYIFHIAYAFVSGETKEDWLWFLTVLQT